MDYGCRRGWGGAAAAFVPDTVIIGYGQSNWLYHVDPGKTSSPPAASAGTYYLEQSGNTWTTTIPVANGLRELLNAVKTTTGGTVGLVSGGQSGVPLSYLMQGSGSSTAFADLATRLTAAGVSRATRIFICFLQGEGDADGGAAGQATWVADVSTLHQSICTQIGKTKAQAPFILADIATTTSTPTDANWDNQHHLIQLAASTNTAMYYSHANIDANRGVDTYHYDAASYGRSGKRYAQTIANLINGTPAKPNWSLVSGTRQSTTVTRVVVAHGAGTDFTPTTGITAFDVSGDNGATWASASGSVTGARVDATTIDLTHVSLGTTARLVRHAYGDNPDVSAIAKDNSSLAVPLNPIGGTISVAGAAALPVFTFASSANTGSSGQTQSRTGVAIADSSKARTVIVGLTIGTPAGLTASSCTVTPTAGVLVNATLIGDSSSAGRPKVVLYRADIPAGASSVDVSVTLSGSPFNNGRIHVGTIPTADLSSTTPVDIDTIRTATAASISRDIDTSSGGCIVALGCANGAGANSTAFSSGDGESFTSHDNNLQSGGTHVMASASNTQAIVGTNTVTLTPATAADLAMVVASFR